MKITKINRRYGACKKYGYEWQVEFNGVEWKKYFALKDQARGIFGHSRETVRPYMWYEDVTFLKSAPYAYRYENSRKPMFVYFRTKTDLEQCIMMFALTNTD